QAAASAGAATTLLGGLGVNPAMAAEVGRSEKPLKAAFSNAGLQATWCAQGKQAAEWWGKLFNVEVTWFDGQLDAVKQRAAIDNNDDMALAAYNIMKAHNRTSILIGGVDAMPPAIQAVSEGRMFATVRNPSCRIHGGAIVAGVAAVTADEKSGKGIPKSVVTDGPVVTKANAAGMQWMEDHFLI